MNPYYYFVGCYGIPSHEICDGWLCARCKRNAWTAVSGLFIPSIVGPFKSSDTCTFVCSFTLPCFFSFQIILLSISVSTVEMLNTFLDITLCSGTYRD